ncbi:hypothetical protein A2U01_0096316, partial [Trifolium medium]|nr:hypothetical protein [Trifolium medium]
IIRKKILVLRSSRSVSRLLSGEGLALLPVLA